MDVAPSLVAGDALLGVGADHAVALAGPAGVLSYETLRELVADRRSDIDHALDVAPGDRRVVVLAGDAGVDWVVTYLALLTGGHVPLLAGDRRERLERRWAPAATIVVEGDAHRIDRHDQPTGGAPALHPDLALLLSTSGATGSPKLVRLSHRNVVANATAIAESLDLTAADRGVTSLPLHYCYGLSVLHSHLAVGAALVTTTASVVDPCFVAAMADHGVTSLAGVPHTFDLLEAAGAERLHLPALRLLTQAGGAMDPEALGRWRARCDRWGIDLTVMYGQTEATARMAVLRSDRAVRARSGAVGVAVPGGSLEVAPVDGLDLPEGVGELVYRGPNVMMGYGVEVDDLAAGPSVEALRTGDLGRYDAEAEVFVVVGRRSRIVKPFGLRIDLDGLARQLGPTFGPVTVAGDDELVVVAGTAADGAKLRDAAAAAAGLPSSAVVNVGDHEVVRTASGKVDHAALLAVGRDRLASLRPSAEPASASAIVAEVLGRAALAGDDTFASAGGDSLSYVEASMRLERVVGRLPDDWQHTPMRELDALGARGTRAGVDTTVVLRAVGICAVVATHMGVAFFPGGAHLLLAVAGFNLSRFQLGIAGRGDRVRAAARTIGRVAVPTVAGAALVLASTDRYGWTTVALVNNYLGPRGHGGGHWHFWFVEAYVQILVVVAALVALPAVRRLERRAPYRFAAAMVAATCVLRTLTWAGLDDPVNLRFRTHGVAWFFALGWLVHRSQTVAQKAATTAVCALVVPGFFGMPQREAFILAGMVLLVWCRRLPVPQTAIGPVAAVASASMWILITHFHVWPPLVAQLPLWAAYPGTIAVGVAAGTAAVAAGRWLGHQAWPRVPVLDQVRAPLRQLGWSQ